MNNLDNNEPIYLQIREKIEDQIVTGLLKEGDQAPSTNQLVNFYKVNHVTVSKGVNQLVDEGILFKKRGVGMFVAEGAKEKLIQQRKEKFIEDHLIKLVEEANILGITEDELIDLIKRVKGRGMK
ncbi:MAG: GntR family transcriptional regulator [Caldibacillus thermoamylovorans]